MEKAIGFILFLKWQERRLRSHHTIQLIWPFSASNPNEAQSESIHLYKQFSAWIYSNTISIQVLCMWHSSQILIFFPGHWPCTSVYNQYSHRQQLYNFIKHIHIFCVSVCSWIYVSDKNCRSSFFILQYLALTSKGLSEDNIPFRVFSLSDKLFWHFLWSYEIL